MKEQTGFIANNEKELEAWSLVLTMNQMVYLIQTDKVEDKIIYLIYTNKIDEQTKERLTSQFEIQLGCLILSHK